MLATGSHRLSGETDGGQTVVCSVTTRNTEELTKCVCDPGEGAQTLLCGRKELQRGELSLKEGYELARTAALCAWRDEGGLGMNSMDVGTCLSEEVEF